MLKKLSLALLLSAACVAQAADYSVVRQYVRVAVVLKGPAKTAELISSGSGVVIAPGFVLTAHHVLPDVGEDIYIGVKGGGAIKGKVYASDEKLGLALITADVDCPCPKIASGEIAIDTPSYVVGYPSYTALQTQFVTIGTVQAVSKKQIVVTASAAPGSSGGGMFVKEDGTYKLAGITNSIVTSPIADEVRQDIHWMNLVIPPWAIRAFLSANNIGY